MIKYNFVYPVFYKFMSSTSFTKKIYRLIANKVGDYLRVRRRISIDEERKIVHFMKEFCDIKKGDRFLELGTGWFHRYSSFVRIFYDIEIILYDVWDNRQFNALKHYINSLPSLFNDEEKKNKDKSIDIISKINSIHSFDEYYSYMGFNYVINKNDNLSPFSENSFSIIFSCEVFEHINSNKLSVSNYIKDIYRILKPGGYSIQTIDIGDHLHWVDRKQTHLKEYLRFSDIFWKRYFDSDIKYINRVQKSEWLNLFNNAGFRLIYQSQKDCEIDSLKINKNYKKFSVDDLKCYTLYIVHQKPFK